MPAIVNLGIDPNGRDILATPRMAAAFEAVVDRARVRPTIVQGAWMSKIPGGGAAASAGYHDKSGCFDTRVWNLTVAEQDAVIRAARELGWAIWLRDHRHGMDPHMHWVLGGEPDMAPGAAWQWTEYLAGRDGLAARGPDYHWRPKRIELFNYQSEEDDMPTAREIADAILDSPINTNDPAGRIETRSVTVREKYAAEVIRIERGDKAAQEYLALARKSPATKEQP